MAACDRHKRRQLVHDLLSKAEMVGKNRLRQPNREFASVFPKLHPVSQPTRSRCRAQGQNSMTAVPSLRMGVSRIQLRFVSVAGQASSMLPSAVLACCLLAPLAVGPCRRRISRIAEKASAQSGSARSFPSSQGGLVGNYGEHCVSAHSRHAASRMPESLRVAAAIQPTAALGRVSRSLIGRL